MHTPAEPRLTFGGTCRGHEGAGYGLPLHASSGGRFLWLGWLFPSDKASGLFSHISVFGLLVGKFETTPPYWLLLDFLL